MTTQAFTHVFPSELGWMALAGNGECVTRLKFGYPSAAAIETALAMEGVNGSDHAPDWIERLAARLQAFACGKPTEFDDVRVDLARYTPFRRRVLTQCRRIPWGKTLTYGQLAARAGSPGAARAVGNIMAANTIPLIIPCHRVVGAGGALGGFSAPGGIPLKQKLLRMETAQS